MLVKTALVVELSTVAVYGGATAAAGQTKKIDARGEGQRRVEAAVAREVKKRARCIASIGLDSCKNVVRVWFLKRCLLE